MSTEPSPETPTAAPSASTPPATDTAPVRGFFQNLVDLYIAPREAFASLARSPGLWLPLALLVALNLGFTAIWVQRVDAREFMRAQDEQSKQWDQLPADRRETTLDAQVRFFPVIAWASAALGAPLLVVIAAALFLFVFRFFYAGELTFRQSMTVVTHAFVAVVLVTINLTLLTLFLKDDWNVNPQEALQANLSLFLDRESVPHALYALAQSLDLFALWILGLLSVGYGVATRRTTSSAAAGVVSVWAILVLVRVAFAALM